MRARRWCGSVGIGQSDGSVGTDHNNDNNNNDNNNHDNDHKYRTKIAIMAIKLTCVPCEAALVSTDATLWLSC